jgi:hypothetical protein
VLGRSRCRSRSRTPKKRRDGTPRFSSNQAVLRAPHGVRRDDGSPCGVRAALAGPSRPMTRMKLRQTGMIARLVVRLDTDLNIAHHVLRSLGELK